MLSNREGTTGRIVLPETPEGLTRAEPGWQDVERINRDVGIVPCSRRAFKQGY